MLTRRIPSTGEVIPAIGLGTWQTFDRAISQSETAPVEEVLGRFSALGGTLVDTSPMYGRAEQVLGRLSRALNLNDRLFLATKVWTRGRRAGIAQMERSMDLLGRPTIDLLQVHNLLDVETHLETLREWKASGRIRYVGITHYTSSAHRDIERIMQRAAPDFVQINLSIAEPEARMRLLPAAADSGVAVLVNRPFACGQLFSGAAERPLPASALACGCQSWAQVFLKWVLAHPAVTCVIPATSQVAHLDDFISAGEGEPLDAVERDRLARDVVKALATD